MKIWILVPLILCSGFIALSEMSTGANRADDSFARQPPCN